MMNTRIKKISVGFAVCFLFLIFKVHSGASVEMERAPAVAGTFYPGNPSKLTEMVDYFLAKAEKFDVPGEVVGLVVPHAGYIYSGQVAAYAFKLLEGKSYDTVVLIGGSHRLRYEGASIWSEGVWKTPLGQVSIDSALAKKISGEDPRLQYTHQPHLSEHSLEVEVPFLQKVLGDFKLVPILLGDISVQDAEILAQAIVKHLKEKKILIVISTDMSHYHTGKEAESLDEKTLQMVEVQDSKGLLKKLQDGECELCGASAVMTMFEISKLLGRLDVQNLNYAHSGDVTGDRSRVVGYFSAVFYRGKGEDLMEESSLTDHQRKELLSLARKTVTSYVSEGKVADFKVEDPQLQREQAVFVTLREKGKLRGCIGHTLPVEPLYLSVRNNAVAAASRDPRFMPVRESELSDIEIEISVLSVPEQVPSADVVDIRKHGVIIQRGGRGGVFLPKVAQETGWDKETFLGQLCSQKAGLPKDCWKDPETQIFVFTAEDFSEKDYL